jgi:hypothetical protein
MCAFEQALQDERRELIAQVDSIWEPLRAQSTRDSFSQALAAL